MNCLIIFIAFFHKIVQKSCQSWKFYKIEKSCCQNAKHYLQSPYSKWIPTRSSDLFFSTAEVIDISTLLPRYWAAWFAALISVSCCWMLAAWKQKGKFIIFRKHVRNRTVQLLKIVLSWREQFLSNQITTWRDKVKKIGRYHITSSRGCNTI